MLNEYEEFHGKAPRNVRDVDFHVPKGLIQLGQAVAIEYRCDKLNGGGDGKMATYRHKFGKGAILCMDERARNQLYILSPHITVDDGGIRN